MTTTVIDRIGLLVTNDPTVGEGALGVVRDASVVLDGDRVLSVGRSGQVADQRIDVGGRCVVPGFVDSHAHLVFAGDRAAEFAARMSGQPYSAGGIRSTVSATRAADDGALAADVHYEEPVGAGEQLRAFDNVLATPHIAGGPRQTLFADIEEIAHNIQQALVTQAAARDTVLICRTCFHKEDEELNWWLLFVPSLALRTAMEDALHTP